MMKNPDIVKRDMMELWKETFHDSHYYIRLVFDAYFTPDNIFVRYDGETLIASLLGVPYEFHIPDATSGNKILKGMYLCGLATRPAYRNKGIMSQLMKEAETSFSDRGFDMTFLIPADSHLREYYRKKGYYDASFRKVERWERDDDGSETLRAYSFRQLFEKGMFRVIEKLACWCREKELSCAHPTLVHSLKDMMTVMSENENSFFLTKGPFDFKYPILANVVAVVFPEVSDDANDPIVRIVRIFFREVTHSLASVPEEIRKAICKLYPNARIELICPFNEKGITQDHSAPYAMVKVLREVPFFYQNENPTFQISLMLD